MSSCRARPACRSACGHPNRCALDYKYLGAHLPGAYAQYVKLPARNLIAMPDRMTWEEGAAFPTAFGCAWHMLITRAELRPGETVLVHAASAGVSTAAIQIAKAVGAHVYATGSADWKLERARQIGADDTINYATHDFQAEIMKRTGKRGVDVVFEHVGGAGRLSASARPTIWAMASNSAVFPPGV